MPSRRHTAAASRTAASLRASSWNTHVTPTASQPSAMSTTAAEELSTPPLMPNATRPFDTLASLVPNATHPFDTLASLATPLAPHDSVSLLPRAPTPLTPRAPVLFTPRAPASLAPRAPVSLACARAMPSSFRSPSHLPYSMPGIIREARCDSIAAERNPPVTNTRRCQLSDTVISGRFAAFIPSAPALVPFLCVPIAYIGHFSPFATSVHADPSCDGRHPSWQQRLPTYVA